MQSLGVGLIGAGNISTTYLRMIPEFAGLELRGIADLNLATAEAQSSAFGVPAITPEALLATADIDIVVNLTIPSVHYQVTAQILEAGKHAYSEKPLVLTADEGAQLRDLAARMGLRVGAAPDTFLGVSHQQARAMIDAGELGQIVSGTAHVLSHGMEAWHPNPDFFFQPGGGPVLDMGPYYITNLVQLLGPVARVAALTGQGRDSRVIGSGPRTGEAVPVATPTDIHALLQFAGGARVTLGASWDVWAHRHGHIELYGTQGALFLPDPNFFGGALEAARGSDQIEPVPLWDHPFGAANDEGRANWRGAGLADMARAIRLGGPHRCGLDMALHVVEVMTAILASGQSGAFVDLTSSCERPAALGAEDARALMV
jgi:predicted dehydrogenase